ncbi:MAG: hypothetical protein Q8N22_02450 [bacterium]|nr:hypothetical protein [bacterium]
MKEKLIAIFVILSLVFAFGFVLNNALGHYDPPTKVKWVEYTVSKDTYLSQVAGALSNKLGKHPGTLVKVMYEKNNLSDYHLSKGTTIFIPIPI